MDITFFTLVVILLTIGLIMLFSASYVYAYTYYGNSYHFITRQAVFALAGLVIMYFVSRIDYHIYRKAAWPLYVLSVLLLIIVLILPPTVGDFHRWIVVGPINFQPSEIAKFAIVLLFAHLISKNYDQMKKFTFGILFLGILLLIVCRTGRGRNASFGYTAYRYDGRRADDSRRHKAEIRRNSCYSRHRSGNFGDCYRNSRLRQRPHNLLAAS